MGVKRTFAYFVFMVPLAIVVSVPSASPAVNTNEIYQKYQKQLTTSESLSFAMFLFSVM